MSTVKQVSQSTFQQEVLQSSLPVLVDFYADWCGPCRLLAPSLEKLAGEFAGRVAIAKVNIDQNPALAGQYQVESIPTLMVVVNGQVVAKKSGLLPEAGLRQALNQIAGQTNPERRVG